MYFNEGVAANFLPRGQAAQRGLDPIALNNLLARAECTQTHALLIIKDDFIVVEQYFGGAPSPIEIMSITKSIASIAIGLLIDDNKIMSVDSPVSNWFPEWNEGLKSRVTIRHILTHTSGVEHEMDAAKLSSQIDQLRYVRGLKVITEPGSIFSYNNEASQLLSGIVQVAAEMPIDEYFKKKLFDPLGIGSWRWLKDQQQNPLTYSGLAMTAPDLARIGWLMLHNGRWQNNVLPPQYIHESTTATIPVAPYMGLSWWLRGEETKFRQRSGNIEALGNNGFKAASKLQPLNQENFYRLEEYWMEAGAMLTKEERQQIIMHLSQNVYPAQRYISRTKGYYADGWLGQRLAIYPGWNMIAVRLHRQLADGGEKENLQAGFPEFLEALEACVVTE
jgi:CubicO group peptidase (beta-lactamase class C family)